MKGIVLGIGNTNVTWGSYCQEVHCFSEYSGKQIAIIMTYDRGSIRWRHDFVWVRSLPTTRKVTFKTDVE